MAYYYILLFMVWLGTHLKCIATRPAVTVNIAIFYNVSDPYMPNILQNADDMLLADRRKENSRGTVYLNRRRFNEAEMYSGHIGLNHSLFEMWNLSSRIHGAIFVDISSYSLFLSSMLEQLSIPTIGIFQSKEQPRTRESPAGFTRLALPSITDYAQVISEIMKKMERRSLCLILSADPQSKEFADAMIRVAEDEKWMIKETLWLDENTTESLKLEVKSLIARQSGVTVVHSRDIDNKFLFQAIKTLDVDATGTIWIMTDITEHGIPDTEALPAGIIKISARRRESSRDQSLYSGAVCDALLLYQAAFERAHALTLDNRPEGTPEGDCLRVDNGKAIDIQDLAKRYLKETSMKGKTSLFEKPSVHETSPTTFEIWNLRRNQNTSKPWALVGLRTPTGLALDTVMAPNGSTLVASRVPVTHTLRVPVNEYYPWVQIEGPRADGKGMLYCLGRGQLCYRFENASRTSAKTTLCCLGASIDLLVMIQNELGFRSEIYFTPDGNYGDFDEETQSWNGIVQEVISGRADFAIDISMNALREEYLDFANPFIHLALNVLVLKDPETNQDIKWSAWLEPFQYQLWLTIVGIINFILIVIWWVDGKSPYGHYKELDSGDDGFTLLDSMTYVWGVAFGKDIGAEKTPHSNSARCVSMFYAFFALVVVNTYCANLMAFLVQENVVLPISGIRDSKLRNPSLQPPDGFKLGIQQHSQEETYFKFHSEEIFREIYHVNLKVNLVKNFADGIEKLKNREIHGLVGDFLSLSQVANNDPNCSLSLAGPNFFNFGLGLAVQKGSLWLEDINRAVLKNQEDNTIQTIEERWFNRKSCDSKPFTKLGLSSLGGLLMTLVIVISFCVFAVLVEFFIVIMLIKCGRRLGELGKFIKRFAFNAKKGEENQLDMQYSFLLRRPRKATFDINASTVSTDTHQELSFHNHAHEQDFYNDSRYQLNGYGFYNEKSIKPREQASETNKPNHEGNAHNQRRFQQNGEIPNGKPSVRDHSNMNGHHYDRTKGVKRNGSMLTKF